MTPLRLRATLAAALFVVATIATLAQNITPPNSYQLTGPGNITGPNNPDNSGNPPTQSITLSCPANPVVYLSSTKDATGNVFVDNYVNLSVNGSSPQDVCIGGAQDAGNPGFNDCFMGDPATASAALNNWHARASATYIGQNPDTFVAPVSNPSATVTQWFGVAPLNLSADFSSGTQNANFQIVDRGGYGGNSALWVVTNCSSVQTQTLQFTGTTFQQHTASFNLNTPDAHSIKFGCTPKGSFNLTVQAFEVAPGDGVCPEGATGDTDIDCRFTQNFSSNPPLCIPYSHGNCVFYRADPSVTAPCAGTTNNVQEYIAWTLPQSSTNVSPNWIYNPRMFDAPVEGGQFLTDITTYFNPNGSAGTDPGTGGRTTQFNDFIIANPFVGSGGSDLTSSYVWVAPLRTSTKNVQEVSGSTIPVKFKLSGAPPAIATTAPNSVNVSVFQCVTSPCNPTDPNNVMQKVVFAGGYTGFVWDPTKQQYQVNLSTSPYKSGNYIIFVSSDLFRPQAAYIKIDK